MNSVRSNHSVPSATPQRLTGVAAILFLLFLLPFFPTHSQGAVRIVATLPDFGTIAEQIGGPLVQVQTLARGTEDVHFVDAKPSFIRILHQAQLLLEGGLELEAGWLPPLLTQSRNARIQPGAPGHVDMSLNIPLIQSHSGPTDRSQGDVHPGGNPHYWLDPAHALIMAQTVLAALKRVDPEHAPDYERNTSRFSQQITDHLKEWDRQLAPLKGTRVITYHRSFDYLLQRYGLELAGTLEPKPGIEPTPPHLKNLIQNNATQPVRWILLEPFRPMKTAEYVAEPCHAQVILLPDKVGADPAATNTIALFNLITARLSANPPSPRAVKQ